MRDPQTYHDPLTFNPSRFLGPNPEPDPRMAFGFGRRICAGKSFAQSTLWINIASVLAVFEITPITAENGQFEELRNEHTSDFAR